MLSSVAATAISEDLMRSFTCFGSPLFRMPVRLKRLITPSVIKGILQMVNGEREIETSGEILKASRAIGYIGDCSESSYWMLETLKKIQTLYPATPLTLFQQIELAMRFQLDEAVEIKIKEAQEISPAILENKALFLLAAKTGYCAFVKLALENENPLNLKESLKVALYFACRAGHTEIAALLLQKRAALSLNGAVDLATPFRAAIDAGHHEIVELLIKEGVRLDLREDTGDMFSYLYLPVREGHYQVVKLLLGWGVQPYHIKTAEYAGHFEIARLLRRYRGF